MQFPIGISTQEGVANGATPFVEDDRYTLGAVMARQRGIPNYATLVTSLQQDQKRFGTHIPGAYGSHVIEDLYRNAGVFGARYYGVRVVGAGTAPAAVTLTHGSGAAAPSITTQNAVLPAVGQYAQRLYTFNNVNVGDTFTIGGISFVATVASPEHVAAGLGAALIADNTINSAHFIGWYGNVLYITHQTTNTAIALTTAVTPLAPATVALMTITAGQFGQQDPGNWGNALSVKIYPYGSIQSNSYTLEVYLSNQRMEQWHGANMADIIAAVNGSSEFIVISGYNTGQAPVVVVTGTLVGGVYVAPVTEAEFYPVSSDSAPKSFGALDGLDISLIFQTEYFTNTVAAQARDYAARTRRIAVVVTPYLAGTSVIAAFANMLQTSSVISRFIAAYNMWGEVADGNGGWKYIPSYGFILGAGFLRIPQMNNDQIWFPPAGLDSVAAGYRNISPLKLSQGSIDDLVRNKTINVAVSRQGQGTFLISSRTMSTHTLFNSIHISRLTNYLLRTLERQFDKVLQKPNTPELRALIVGEITQYFRGLYGDGALERSIPFNKAFSCICDTTNNPLSADRKQLVVDIYWIPAEAVEAVRINLNRNDGTLVASVQDTQTV